MADNLNQQELYVESNYDNIILIDPNKIVVNGEVQDRLVNHEDLVFYANLEARIIPRTKLAVGEEFNSPVVNTLVATIQGQQDSFEKINFLLPKGKNNFDTSWSDQITGKGSRQGLGANQTGERYESKDNITRVFRNVKNYEDTQTLGIKSINIRVQPNGGPGSFVPDVKMQLVDIGGRTLFEQGENSIYSTFFNMPYPQFYLTIKGYYGKAIRYTLFMTEFSARFDDSTGNFNIDIKLSSNMLSLLQDTPLTYAKTAPKMFPIVVSQNGSSNNSVGGNKTSINTLKVDYLGKQVLNQVYQEYENKKLISKGFPRLSIDEFIKKTDNFVNVIRQEIENANFVSLNDIKSFRDELEEIKNRNYTVLLSRYLDTTNYISYDNGTGTEIYYEFNQTIPLQKRDEIEKAIIDETKNSVEILKSNKTFGTGGFYKIGDKSFQSEIPVNFPEDELFYELDQNKLSDKDFKDTYNIRYGRQPTDAELLEFKVQLLSLLQNKEYRLDPNTNTPVLTKTKYIKYGLIDPNTETVKPGGFLDRINTYIQKLNAKEEEIETKFSNQLSDKVTKSDGTIGFKPTIRNIMAIIIAGCDTFYRLMDKTHRDAWEKRNDPLRIKSIIPAEKSSGIDSKNVVNYSTGKLNEQNSVYPWPTYYVIEKQEDKREAFVIRYLGDPKYSSKTFAFDYNTWPEIKFTEAFLEASVRKASSSQSKPYENLENIETFSTVNALEFPFKNKPYLNTTELEVFYELYERLYVLANYSNILAKQFNPQSLQADTFISHLEAQNIINAITENFTIQEKLQNTAFNYENSYQYLKTLANNGTADRWLNLERGIFNTPYLQNLTENSFGLYSKKSIDGYTLALENNDPLAPKFKQYVEERKELDYERNNFSPKSTIDEKALTFLDDIKVLARLKKNDYYTNILPYRLLEYNVNNSKKDILVNPTTNNPVNNLIELKDYFSKGENVNFTEKYYRNIPNYSGNVSSTQINSNINTPYFVNALQKGVELEKSGNNTTAYVALGYMYLNSYDNPLSYYYTYDKDFKTTDLIFSDNNISKLDEYEYSQILKIGSLYHRYKKYIETGEDILDGVINDFDFTKNYDPLSQNLEKIYKIKNYTGGSQDFICQYKKIDANDNTKYVDIINTGFYPKLISDVHYYFTGKDLFTGYTESEFTDAYTAGTLNIGVNKDASYFMPFGGDPNNLKRSIILNPYFSYLTFDKKYNIDSQNKIHILIPSNGGIPLNQAKFEFFKNDKLTYEILSSKELFNGSVRTLWGQPNYGFFPKTSNILENNIFLSPDNDLFDSIGISFFFEPFRKEILDKFEELFLGFCKKRPEPKDVLILEDDVQDPSYFSSGGITSLKNRKLFDQMLSIFSVNDASSPLTKIQENNDGLSLATTQKKNNANTFREFLIENPIIFKNGNPLNFNRKLFTSLTTIPELKNLSPITFSPYVPGTLPGDGILTGPNALLTSRTLSQKNVDAWKSLQLHIYNGFGNLDYISYNNTGCTITDFFIDMNIEFTKENVETCEELIKRYSFKKFYAISNGNTYNKTNFISYIDNLLQENLDTQKNLTNQVFQYIRSNLPNVSLQSLNNPGSVVGDINKLSTYIQLQTFNNRWVAGSDLITRPLFEDFLFMNSANADIGDQLQFFVDMVVNLLKEEKNVSIADVIGEMAGIDQTTLFYATPAFINFNGVLDAENYDKPIDINIPNSLFGTYRNVDYLNSRQKFIFLYLGKPSEHPAMNDNRNVVYGDDSFDFKNQSDNTQRIEQTPDTNFYKSDKIVGFNVDFGIRNQNMFTKFNVGMGNEKQTLETFKVNEQFAKGSSGDKVSQETQSMYSYYKSLSYNISVSSLGNAMIQPLMYFNLRHVPLFYGPYKILEVNHTINENGFTTDFSGIRVPKYALPNVDSISTFIKKNYLEKYKQDILNKEYVGRYQADVETILDPSRQSQEPTVSPEEECEKQVDNKYKSLPYVNQKVDTISIADFVSKIKAKQPNKYIDATILTIALSRATNLIDDRPCVGNTDSTIKDGSILSFLNNNAFLLTPNNIYPPNPEFEALICLSFPEGSLPMFSISSTDGGLDTMNTLLFNIGPLLEGIKNEYNETDENLGWSKAIASFVVAYQVYLFSGSYTAADIKNITTTNLSNGSLSQSYFDSLVKLSSACLDKF